MSTAAIDLQEQKAYANREVFLPDRLRSGTQELPATFCPTS